MISQKTLYFFCFILYFSISSHVGNSAHLATACNQTAAYDVTTPTGKLFLKNIVDLYSVLYSNASQPNGFYNYTSGGGSSGPPVYGLFLCRGDATATICQSCLVSAVAKIIATCPNVTRAVTWYDDCMLRQSDEPIYSKLETEGGWLVWETRNVTDGARLNQTLGEVFNKITLAAAYSKVPGKKFAVAEADFIGFTKIYAMGQCTPDLSNLDCDLCLRDAITDLPDCCTNRQGGYVLHPSCNIRYSTTPFFGSVAPSPQLPTPTLPPPSPQRTPLLPFPPSDEVMPPPPPQVQVTVGTRVGGGFSAATISAIVSPLIITAFVAFLATFLIGCV